MYSGIVHTSKTLPFLNAKRLSYSVVPQASPVKMMLFLLPCLLLSILGHAQAMSRRGFGGGAPIMQYPGMFGVSTPARTAHRRSRNVPRPNGLDFLEPGDNEEKAQLCSITVRSMTTSLEFHIGNYLSSENLTIIYDSIFVFLN